jgi:hypothetical protein
MKVHTCMIYFWIVNIRFYSILVGEEPNSVFLKKEEKVEPSQDDMGCLFLSQRSYHFQRAGAK